MRHSLGFLIVIAVVAGFLGGCSGDEYGFIGDPGLVPGFPINGGGGGGAGGGASYIPSIPPDGDLSFLLEWTLPVGAPVPDVDLHVNEPSGEHVYFGNPISASGGQLDYDDTSTDPDGTGGPERIFWPFGTAPSGTYEYGIRWFGGVGSADYALVVYIGATQTQIHTGTITPADNGLPFTIIGTMTY